MSKSINIRIWVTNKEVNTKTFYPSSIDSEREKDYRSAKAMIRRILAKKIEELNEEYCYISFELEGEG